MSNTVKCMKLDLLLLKPYLKSMLLVLLVPIVFPLFTGTLFEGLSFAATVMAMTTGYTFSVVEKNGVDRFYGFLPVKRSTLVAGRYLIVFLLGFIALLVTLAVQIIILKFMSTDLSLQDIVATFLICGCLFCLYAGIQIPGYYRFGSIKGKLFMFIPTVGFLLFYYVVRSLTTSANGLSPTAISNSVVLIVGAVAVMAFIIAVSAFVSMKIVGKVRS